MHNHAATSVETKMATMQHKNFCVREFIKTESATAEQRAFRILQLIKRLKNLKHRNHLSGVC